MSIASDLTDRAGSLGLPYHEPEVFPMLADYECAGCGLIPGIEVVACSCGRHLLPAGTVVAGTTTVSYAAGVGALVARLGAL